MGTEDTNFYGLIKERSSVTDTSHKPSQVWFRKQITKVNWYPSPRMAPFIDYRSVSLANLISTLLVLIKNKLDKMTKSPEDEPLNSSDKLCIMRARSLISRQVS